MKRVSVTFTTLLFVAVWQITFAVEPAVRPRADDSQTDAERVKFDRIADRYWKIVSRRPRRGTAFDSWFKHYAQAGRLPELKTKTAGHVEQNPDSAAAHLLLGLVRESSGEDESLQSFQKAVELDANDYFPWSLLGSAYAKQFEFKKAVEAFQKSLALKPPPTEMLAMSRQLGQLQLRLGKTDDALKTLGDVSKRFPRDSQVQRELAELLSAENQYEAAIERWQQVVTAASKDRFQQLKAKIEIAELHAKAGRRQTSVDQFTKILADVKPTGWAADDVRKRIETVFLNTNDQKSLLEYCKKRLKFAPDDLGTMLMMARTQVRSGQRKYGMQTFRDAINLAPTDRKIREQYVTELINGGDFEWALEQCEILTTQHPSDPDLLRLYGETQLQAAPKSGSTAEERTQAEEKAISIWKRIAELRKDDSALAIQVAEACRYAAGLTKQDSFFAPQPTQANVDTLLAKTAEEYYREAIRRNPSESRFYEYLGEYLHTVGKSDEAITTWAKITQPPRDNAAGWHRLAEVYANYDYLDQAIAAGEKALQLNPNEFDYHDFQYRLMIDTFAYDKANQHVDNMQRLAENDGQDETALKRRVEFFDKSDRIYEEIDRLRKLARKQQSTARDEWTLALLFSNRWRLSLAADAFRRAVEKEPDDIRIQRGYAKILERTGRIQQAVELHRKLVKTDRSNRTDSYQRIVNLELRLDHDKLAREAAEELAALSPGSLDSYRLRANVAFRTKDPERGLEILQSATRIAPDDIQLRDQLAGTLAEHRKFDESMKQFWKCFEQSDSLRGRVSFAGKLATVAAIWKKQDMVDRFPDLDSRFRKDYESGQDKRTAALCLTEVYRISGRITEAGQVMEDLVARHPDDVLVVEAMISFATTHKNWPEALKWQKHLIELQPGGRGLHELARLYLLSGNPVEASAIWKQILLESNDDTPVIAAIDKRLRAGEFTPAKALVEKWIELAPDNHRFCYRAGLIYLIHQQNEKATEYFLKCRELLASESQTSQSRRPDRSRRNRNRNRFRSGSGGTTSGLTMLAYKTTSQTLPAFQEIVATKTIYESMIEARKISKESKGSSSSQKRAYQQKLTRAIRIPKNRDSTNISALCALHYLADNKDLWLNQQYESLNQDPGQIRQLLLLYSRPTEEVLPELTAEYVKLNPDDPFPHVARFRNWAVPDTLKAGSVEKRKAYIDTLSESFAWIEKHRPDLRADVLPSLVLQATAVQQTELAEQLLAKEIDDARVLGDLGAVPAIVFDIDNADLHKRYIAKLDQLLAEFEKADQALLTSICQLLLFRDSKQMEDQFDVVFNALDQSIRLSDGGTTTSSLTIQTSRSVRRVVNGKSTTTAAPYVPAQIQQMIQSQLLARQRTAASYAYRVLTNQISQMQSSGVSADRLKNLMAKQAVMRGAMRSTANPGFVFPVPGPNLSTDIYVLLQQLVEQHKQSGQGDKIVDKLESARQNLDPAMESELLPKYMMAEVCALWWLDKQNEAAERLAAYALKNSNDQCARFQLAQIYLQVKQIPKALETLDSIKTSEPPAVPKATATSTSVTLTVDSTAVYPFQLSLLRAQALSSIHTGSDAGILTVMMNELDASPNSLLKSMYVTPRTHVSQTNVNLSTLRSTVVGTQIVSDPRRTGATIKVQATPKTLPYIRMLNAAEVNSINNKPNSLEDLAIKVEECCEKYPLDRDFPGLLSLIRFRQRNFVKARESVESYTKLSSSTKSGVDTMLIVEECFAHPETITMGTELLDNLAKFGTDSTAYHPQLGAWTSTLVASGYQKDAERLLTRFFERTKDIQKTSIRTLRALATDIETIDPRLAPFALQEVERLVPQAFTKTGGVIALGLAIEKVTERMQQLGDKSLSKQTATELMKMVVSQSETDSTLNPCIWSTSPRKSIAANLVALTAHSGTIHEFQSLLKQHKTDGTPQQDSVLLALKIEAAVADGDYSLVKQLAEQIPQVVLKTGKPFELLSGESQMLVSSERIVAMLILRQKSANSVTLKSGTTISDVSKLQRNPFKIVAVNASRSPAVNDKSMALIAGLSAVRDLDISQTEVTDAGALHLTRLRTLESLNIAGTKITETTLPAILGRLPNLKLLKVGKMKLSDKTKADIQKRLPKCRIVTDTTSPSASPNP